MAQHMSVWDQAAEHVKPLAEKAAAEKAAQRERAEKAMTVVEAYLSSNLDKFIVKQNGEATLDVIFYDIGLTGLGQSEKCILAKLLEERAGGRFRVLSYGYYLEIIAWF